MVPPCSTEIIGLINGSDVKMKFQDASGTNCIFLTRLDGNVFFKQMANGLNKWQVSVLSALC